MAEETKTTTVEVQSGSAQARTVTTSENWFSSHWRPLMGWQYAAVCLFDFILAPIMLVLFSYKTGQPYIQWHPITLEGAGTYHISMMAILGITSWSRGQEKIKEMTQGN